MAIDSKHTNRRSDRLGVHSIDHFCIAVPDLDLARHFYQAFGLTVLDRDGELHLHTHGHAHRWAIVREGPAKRLEYLSFGIYAEDLCAFRDRITEKGLMLARPDAEEDGEGLWLRDCEGTLLQLKIAEKCSPDEKAKVVHCSPPPGTRGVQEREHIGRVLPRHLSHILLFTSNLQRSIAFYTDVLGLRLSDEAGVVAFLHGAHGSDHHLLAFAQSNAPGLHHSSWDVASIQDVGLGAIQMATAGYKAGWGMGRHVLGSNYFHYVRDPWSSYAEYSCDMDYVPGTMEWEAKVHTPENAFYLWGPEPPADFATNYEAGGPA
jgi:catechol 2,3-dioxygenase